MITLDRVSVHYGRTPALLDFSIEVAAGETVALLGPSGSGKSTALKAVAGFLRPSSGRIRLGGADVTEVPPRKRGIGVVVQQYALFPHLTVAENVAFGLRARRRPRPEVARRVSEMLDTVGMAAYKGRFPRELSGGQQQRVAIARALAIRPSVLLLDEPLSALDAKLRADLLGELQRLRAAHPELAILYVTHDQAEALALADRIAVMADARLVDLGATEELYRRPPSAFTAGFLGGANLLPAEVLAVTADSSAGTVRLRLAEREVTARPTAPLSAGDKALLCVRRHSIAVTTPGEGLPARLTAVQWRGESYRLTCDLAGTELHADVPTVDGLPPIGAEVALRLTDATALPAS